MFVAFSQLLEFSEQRLKPHAFYTVENHTLYHFIMQGLGYFNKIVNKIFII